ncbi:MAG: hypothetical protein B7L53_05870 [Thermofilum sp. NZ13]|nr:MAG: hypothetical protein B7L53_05870 [Thermofilum sp. NZ13]
MPKRGSYAQRRGAQAPLCASKCVRLRGKSSSRHETPSAAAQPVAPAYRALGFLERNPRRNWDAEQFPARL